MRHGVLGFIFDTEALQAEASPSTLFARFIVPRCDVTCCAIVCRVLCWLHRQRCGEAG